MARMNEMIQTAPIAVEKSIRSDELRSLTSCQAGKIVPVAFVPLLREDRVSRGNVNISFDMAETTHPLLNAVNVTCYAHFISNLAFERFDGMDSLNRSYQGIPEAHDATVIPWVDTIAFQETGEFWQALGVYWPNIQQINKNPLEAYNILVNYRRKARTDQLPVRAMQDTSLAEAFWKNSGMTHIVPDWDQAALDGEVPLEFANPEMHIQGFGRKIGQANTAEADVNVYDRDADGNLVNTVWDWGVATDGNALFMKSLDSVGNPVPTIDVRGSEIRLSLSNIELAKQTAAFAKLRDRYEGLDDDHIIDLLMEGIRVPDEAMKQPILLDRKSTVFGYTERHAMDGASLDQSVTTGQTRVSMNFRTPPMNTGGIVLITAEIVPEQLHERKSDIYLSTLDPAQYPNFMRDYLDPEKVEAVSNKYVDVLHSEPNNLFGYAPLNHAWKRSITRTGGKFRRQNPDTFVEDRQRFWSSDIVDPTLADDFYLVKDLPNSVFADTISDPFEVLTLGSVSIIGNTVFGETLHEDAGSYEAIIDQVDTDRMDPVAPGAPMPAQVPAKATANKKDKKE